MPAPDYGGWTGRRCVRDPELIRPGETIVVVIDRRVERNHSHATQVGRWEYVELAGLGPKVNRLFALNWGP